jgi:hypothetical protein
MMMSIDVGIKNLSFVIFEPNQLKEIVICKNPNNQLLWNILDITPPQYNFTCSHKTKKGKICGKSSVIKYTNMNESFCNSHKKFVIENQPVTYFDRNKISLDDIYTTLVQKLDDLFKSIPQVSKYLKNIIIEKQPPNNPRMKAIMSVIHSYFIIRGKVDHYMDLYLDNIYIIDAKHKLSIYKGPQIDASHLKKKYDQRKYLSVQYTKYIISENIEYSNHFESLETKKDDLADCFLQAKYFVERVYKIKSATQNNMISFYKSIDLSKTKKNLIYSDKKLSIVKSINLYTLKHLVTNKQINEKNYLTSPYKLLLINCCKKFFGISSVSFMDKFWKEINVSN